MLLFPLVGVASLWNIASQSRDFQALTLAYGPAFDANNAALIDMTEANAGWSQLMGGSAPLTRYRLKQDAVIGDLANIERALVSPSLPVENRTRYAALLGTQRAAVDAWFRSAQAAEDQISGTRSARSSLEADAIDRFRIFRDGNRGLYDAIRLDRDASREEARTRRPACRGHRSRHPGAGDGRRARRVAAAATIGQWSAGEAARSRRATARW